LQLVLAIRDQVPDAADVFTPMAVRALLRNKEAARRYRPAIEALSLPAVPRSTPCSPCEEKREHAGQALR
jgi:hypothetical protein